MSDNLARLAVWLEEVERERAVLFVKVLAYNDTRANERSHQCGPYVAKDLLRTAFPELTHRSRSEENPDCRIWFTLDSHTFAREVRLVWYNSAVLHPGRRPRGRDEARMTRWGTGDLPFLSPDAPGSLMVFAYLAEAGKDAVRCRAWLCEAPEEADLVLERVGGAEPGEGRVVAPPRPEPAEPVVKGRGPCWISASEAPPAWLKAFPSGAEIVAFAAARRPATRELPPDRRLLARRDCEYEVFRSLEELALLPRVKEGFRSVDTFVRFANEVTNRRKSRAGRSLELQAKAIFDEEGLPFAWAQPTEAKKVPDFIFPSIERYHDPSWSRDRLRMLAAKTTCKDRWRQILDEAARVDRKHLLTLQRGVSLPQFRQMTASGVILVVPTPLHRDYPAEVRGGLVSLERFIGETKAICGV